MFWTKLLHRLAWAIFAVIFGLTLLLSLSIFHNPLDFGSFDQYCPAGMVDLRLCKRGLLAGALGAVLGVGVAVIAFSEILNITFRALTGRPIESYAFDGNNLSLKRHSVFVPSWSLCLGGLSFRPEGRSIKVLGMTERGVTRSLKLGPFEQSDMQALMSCLNAEKERQ